MKTLFKKQRKRHASCFHNIRWVSYPSDAEQSPEEIYKKFQHWQEIAEKRKNPDKLLPPVSELSSCGDIFNLAPVHREREERPVEDIISTAVEAVSFSEQPEFSGVLADTQRGWEKASVFKRSSMQIVEDHLLSKVFIRRLYGAIYLFTGKYYGPLTEQDYTVLLRRESDDKLISILKTYRQFSDAYRFLSSNPDIEFKDYDRDSARYKTFAVFENVLVDARTGIQYDHDPNYPVFFGVNANYKQEPDETPYWDYFVESVSQGDKKIRKLLHEMLGYLLLQGNDGKCFFVLATAPNSGKSLFGEFIGLLFPDEYVSHLAIDNLSDRFALGRLWKTKVNVSMDLPQSRLNEKTVSLVKTITGDSKIETEEKYMPISTALNCCKLVFGTNSQISITTPDRAFWDRVIVVPFLHEIPRKERRTDLLSHLLEEKDDILSKCIPYVQKLIERNYEFTIPEVSAVMKDTWSGNTGDAIGKFFAQHCEISDGSEGIALKDLYKCFLDFCHRNRLAPDVEDDRNFSRQLQLRYSEITQKKRRISGAKNPVSVFENVNYYSDKE